MIVPYKIVVYELFVTKINNFQSISPINTYKIPGIFFYSVKQDIPKF